MIKTTIGRLLERTLPDWIECFDTQGKKSEGSSEKITFNYLNDIYPLIKGL